MHCSSSYTRQVHLLLLSSVPLLPTASCVDILVASVCLRAGCSARLSESEAAFERVSRLLEKLLQQRRESSHNVLVAPLLLKLAAHVSQSSAPLCEALWKLELFNPKFLIEVQPATIGCPPIACATDRMAIRLQVADTLCTCPPLYEPLVNVLRAAVEYCPVDVHVHHGSFELLSHATGPCSSWSFC